jgi:hypothetical protein
MKKLDREKKDVQRTLTPELLKAVKGGDEDPPPSRTGVIIWA